MNKQELDEIRQRVEAASKGPWLWDGNELWINGTDIYIGITTKVGSIGPSREDKAFTAHARTDIPKLLAYIDELEARCGKN